jgi:nucleoside-diphosphate-sugar epimerase
MTNVLITGGAGFIGTHLAERLCADGSYQITLLDNFRRDSLQYAPALKSHSNVKTVTADVENAAEVSEIIKGIDVVVHLAAIAGVSSYYSEPLQTLRTNILGTVNMLECASKADVRMFIHFSTSEVYGPNALWVDETTPHGIGPVADLRWVYATSKLSGENFTLRYAEKYGFDCAVVRPFNIYGPRQVGEGAISNFCRAVAKDQPMLIYGDGSAIRAWCYIDDLVDAVITLIKNPPKEHRVFNIGNPREVETTLGLARRVIAADHLGKASCEFREGVHSEVRVRIPSIERARSVLSFEPKVTLEAGLKRTLEWFRTI